MAEVSVPLFSIKRRRTRTYDAKSTNNIEEIVSAVTALLVPVGTLVPTLSASEPTEAWKICDGQSLSKEDFPTLYALIGGQYGETATTFALPDLRGRSVIGAGGDPALSLLSFGGAASLTLTEDQLPAHDHGFNDPGHTHTFTGAEHSHTITDTGHSHTVTDTGHTHTVTDPGHGHSITDPGHTHSAIEFSGVAEIEASGVTESYQSGSTGSATTGISIVSNTTGVTVDSGTTGVSVDSGSTGVTVDSASIDGSIASGTTGITIDSAGGGESVDIIPPVVAINWMIRT